MGKIGQNVGSVRAEGKLLCMGLRDLGYEVVQVSPMGKIDAAGFSSLTGYRGRTNQHERDAGLLAFGGR